MAHNTHLIFFSAFPYFLLATAPFFTGESDLTATAADDGADGAYAATAVAALADVLLVSYKQL